jgi:hypothetical protein
VKHGERIRRSAAVLRRRSGHARSGGNVGDADRKKGQTVRDSSATKYEVRRNLHEGENGGRQEEGWQPRTDGRQQAAFLMLGGV